MTISQQVKDFAEYLCKEGYSPYNISVNTLYKACPLYDSKVYEQLGAITTAMRELIARNEEDMYHLLFI